MVALTPAPEYPLSNLYPVLGELHKTSPLWLIAVTIVSLAVPSSLPTNTIRNVSPDVVVCCHVRVVLTLLTTVVWLVFVIVIAILVYSCSISSNLKPQTPSFITVILG